MSIRKKTDGVKPVKTYYATCRNFGFNVTVQKAVTCSNCKGLGRVIISDKSNKTEECPVCNGKKTTLGPIIKQAPNGTQAYIGNEPQWLEEFHQFSNIRSSNQHGYVSLYEVYKDTPQYVVDELEKMCNDATIDTAMFQDAFEKAENPGRFAQLEKNRELKETNEALKAELAKNKDAVADVDKTVKKAVDKAVKEEKSKTADAIKSMQSQVDKLEADAKKG